jgi:hypothetical protein
MKGDYKFNISRYLNGNNSGRNFSEILWSNKRIKPQA